MNRNGPNYSDDPRVEAGGGGPEVGWRPLSATQIATNRYGIDLARVAIGLPTKYKLQKRADSVEEKPFFDTNEASDLFILISNSDLNVPSTFNRALVLIQGLFESGKISEDDYHGLRSFVEQNSFSYLSDNVIHRSKDVRELQINDI